MASGLQQLPVGPLLHFCFLGHIACLHSGPLHTCSSPQDISHSQSWHLQYPGGVTLGSTFTASHSGFFKSNHITQCLGSAAFQDYSTCLASCETLAFCMPVKPALSSSGSRCSLAPSFYHGCSGTCAPGWPNQRKRYSRWLFSSRKPQWYLPARLSPFEWICGLQVGAFHRWTLEFKVPSLLSWW